MPREKLTIERIRRYRCPEGVQQTFRWDTESPLAVRITAAGAKSYIFQAKLAKATIRLTIGDVKDWNLDDARAEAHRLQTRIDKGIDPRQEKADQLKAVEEKRKANEEEKRRAEQRKAPALDAWKAYVEVRQTGKKKWGELHLRDHERVSQEGGKPITRGRRNGRTTTLPGALRPLLSLPLDEITSQRVKAWLEDETARRPTHAALAFRLLAGFVAWCAEHEEYKGQAHAKACTTKDVREELPEQKSKNDNLRREMLRPWFEHVRKLPNPVHAAYLQMLLLTGARREELAGLRWTDVDFQWKSLTIKDKVEGHRTIPLTPFVATLLRDLKARNETPPKQPRKLAAAQVEKDKKWKPSEWVFTSPLAKSGRLQEPRIGHAQALAAAGLPVVTLHGLRRSFSNLTEWVVECPVGVVAQLMGHKPSATAERHYKERSLDLLQMWHTKIEAWILNEAGIEQPAAVGTSKLESVPGRTA